MTHFIDTNIFLRYFVASDPQKTQACFNLFQKAKQEEIALTTSESVIAEVVFVLSSKKHYNEPRERVRALLYPLLSLPRFILRPYRKKYLRALDLYASYPIDFTDCLTAAHIEQRKPAELYSYDTDFDRIATVKRLEP